MRDAGRYNKIESDDTNSRGLHNSSAKKKRENESVYAETK